MVLTRERLRGLIREILLEYSKNDPIPEINRKQEGLGIVLLGPPGSGKGTFYRNFILPKQRNIRTFNSDDVSDLRSLSMPDVEPGEYVRGSSGLTVRKLGAYLQTGQNFVYDLTGNSPRLVKPAVDAAKEAGYELIFVHLLIPTNKAVRRVKQRNKAMTQPEVDIEYVKDSYDKAQSLIKKYDKMDPDEYYIVVNVEDDEPMYMKYKSGKVFIRKGDQYVRRK